MKKFVCKMCGYVELKDAPPEKCPQCGAPASQFEEQEDALKTDADESGLKEKHVPEITLSGDCSMAEGCVDAHIKVGSTLHPMEPDKHWIMFVDLYLDNEFISRIKFDPAHMNPAVSLHLKTSEGELAVVSHCNLHGNYIGRQNLAR